METQPPSPAAGHEPRTVNGSPWTLPLVLAVALAITAALLVKFRQQPQEGAPEPGNLARSEQAVGWIAGPAADSEIVSLTIDFGNGARRDFARLPWTEGMTVADVLKSAGKFRPGITYTQRGELLTSIDGITNGMPAERFWLYEVNDRPGKVSLAVQPVAVGDRILWAFKAPE
jgi:hypothetical protein